MGAGAVHCGRREAGIFQQHRLDVEPVYAFAGDALAIPPHVPLDGVQSVIDETLRVNPAAAIRDAALVIDIRLVQAVEATGFVLALLAEYPCEPR